MDFRFSWGGAPAVAVAEAPGRTATPPWPAQSPDAMTAAAATEGRLLSRRAFLVTVVAICVGGLGTAVSYAISRDTTMDPSTYLRYAMVITLAIYAVVGVLVVTQITPSVRLRWRTGPPLVAVATGLAVGGALSALGLAVVSSAAGHLNPDPRIVTLMSEGDAPHILGAVLITCAAAPLIEEVLFRGLLLESLRGRGTRFAIWISGLAFAAWHLNPAALRYYALMGALLGFLYVKRGLICSISAHLAFNGVLTIAAVVVVTSAGPTINADGLSLRAASGWSTVPAGSLTASLGELQPAFALKGPAGSSFIALSFATAQAPDPDRLVQRLSGPDSSTFGGSIRTDTLRERKLPLGRVVVVVVQVGGESGTVAFLPRAGRTYEFVFDSAGSPKATADYSRMLEALRVS
jgi:membrane protease YdiL (CAAX protease family)